MSKFFMLLMFSLLMLPMSSNATTHIWFWINGDTSQTLTQGDDFAWELDLSAVGNSVAVEIYLDLNASRTIDSGDYLLDTLPLQDGEQGDGPSDSSAVPDGIIYLQFGSFGFAPQNYILRATDEDQSTAANWFEIIVMPDPVATVSGNITIEGSEKPNAKYENVMIGAMGENGMFSGLTDVNGDYTINLPLAGVQWRVGTIFDNTLPGYTIDPREYEMSIPAGNTGSLDFTFKLPSSYVYGSLYDQNGAIIDRDGWIYLQNQTTGSETESVVRDGHYAVPALVVIQGSDSTNTFIIRTDDQMLIPDYLKPNDNKTFEVTWGDSMAYNLVAYQTDAKIFGYITEDGQNPSKIYQFMAWSDSLGSTLTESDPSSGYFELSVRQGTSYNVWLQDDPQWGTPPPPGYVIEKNWQVAMPGDTVYFNLVPASAAVSGSITFESGDPVNLDHERSRVTAWDSTYTGGHSANIDDSDNFFIPLTDGRYDVAFNHDNNQYLSMPNRYTNVMVSGDTVGNLNFELNYAHATLTVKLLGDIPAQNPDYYGISSAGTWPWVYQTGSQLRPDSTFQLRLCEGEWYLNMSLWVNLQEYAVFPSDTTLTVTENDSSYYVEFTYRLLAGIAKNEQTPVSFYLNQNYPNPFNPSTTINYGLMKTGQVKLDIYNILGEKVASLVDGVQNAGSHQLVWSPVNLASGVYLYRLETEGFVQTKKLILIR
jgi:hypothetical protein